MSVQRRALPFSFVLFLLLFTLFSLFLSMVANRRAAADAPTLTPMEPTPTVVILDAGHGGEDGGAVSVAGDYEKDLNLALCQQMEILLKANGIPTVMTRTEDILLYDKTVDYHGRKKALDLAARRAIAEAYPNGIFVSIHMNSYPIPRYHGLQVWYSPNHSASHALAEAIQATVAATLQPANDRAVKAAGSNIYLLHRLQSPAVLVECGFLSNPEEAELLGDPAYRRQLALVLFLSLMEFENPSKK